MSNKTEYEYKRYINFLKKIIKDLVKCHCSRANYQFFKATLDAICCLNYDVKDKALAKELSDITNSVDYCSMLQDRTPDVSKLCDNINRLTEKNIELENKVYKLQKQLEKAREVLSNDGKTD